MRLIDADELHIKLLDIEFPVSDMDAILDAMDLCAISPPPNDPLTLEQLREMDGEPVWNDTTKRWSIVDTHSRTTTNVNGCWRPFSDRYYRRKPEEGSLPIPKQKDKPIESKGGNKW